MLATGKRTRTPKADVLGMRPEVVLAATECLKSKRCLGPGKVVALTDDTGGRKYPKLFAAGARAAKAVKKVLEACRRHAKDNHLPGCGWTKEYVKGIAFPDDVASNENKRLLSDYEEEKIAKVLIEMNRKGNGLDRDGSTCRCLVSIHVIVCITYPCPR